MLNKIARLLLCFVFILNYISLDAVVKFPPERAILPNGLRVVVVQDKSLPLAAGTILFDTSSFYYTNPNIGVDTIYTSLLRYAQTGQSSRFDFNEELESLGLLPEFGAYNDYIHASFDGSSEDVNTIIQALYSIGFDLQPSQEDFTRAKNTALRQLETNKRFPSASGLMERQIWSDLFGDEIPSCLAPICHEGLNSIEFSDVEQFQNEVFLPNNAVVVIVGDVNSSEIFTKCMEVFGELQASTKTTVTTICKGSAESSGTTYKVDYYNIDQTHVLLGFKAPCYTGRLMPATYLWQYLLHDINDSWLENNIGRNFPDLENVFARYIPLSQKGVFLVGFTSNNPNVEVVINRVLSSLSTLYVAPPRGGELQRAINLMQLDELETRESRMSRAFELGLSELKGTFRIADSFYTSLNRISQSDMTIAAQKVFSGGNFAVRIAKPVSQKELEESRVVSKKLENGASIIVRANPGSEFLGLTMVFGVDSCAEDDRERALNVLVAETISDYINDKDNRRVRNRLDEIGARLEAVYDGDAILMTARAQTHRLDNLLEFIGQFLNRPAYPRPFFERARKRMIEQRQQQSLVPSTIIRNKLMDKMYPGMNVGLNEIDAELLELITFEEVQEYYRKWAVASNLSVAAVGNFSPEATLKSLKNTFGNLESGKRTQTSTCPIWAREPLEKTSIIRVELPPSETEAIIAVGFRMKPFLDVQDPEELYYIFGANSVLAHILFISSNAIVGQQLRDIDALISLNGFYRTNNLISVLGFSTSVAVEKVDESVEIINNLLESISEMDISEGDILKAGRNISSFFNRTLQTSDAQAATLARYFWYGLKEDYLDQLLETFSKTKPEHVIKGARRNFDNWLMIIGVPAGQ